MREIKFRAVHKKAKGMAEWDLLKTLKMSRLEDDNFIFMQYTGLKDKSGKEIYEGDLVKFNNCDYQRTAGHLDDEIITGEVSHSCGAWSINTRDNRSYDLYSVLVNDEETEVVGNIYENPELI